MKSKVFSDVQVAMNLVINFDQKEQVKTELGIPQGSCQPEELFSFNYFSQYDGLSEYEIDHVF